MSKAATLISICLMLPGLAPVAFAQEILPRPEPQFEGKIGRTVKKVPA
jgi:hypothetical protein